MRRQYIKGGDDKPFEIIEDDQNNQGDSKPVQQPKLHRYDGQLDKLSKPTKDTLKKNK